MLSIVVRTNSYQDSVVLMLLSRTLSDLEGVTKASVMMGTPANRAILEDTGFSGPELDTAGAGDLVIAVDAVDAEASAAAVEQAEALLASQTAASRHSSLLRTRTVARALTKAPDASLALVSVPGRHVAEVVPELLDHGVNTMIFSDNVPVEVEVALKEEARKRGLLVMGPDCGTGVISGVPLAFANVAREGGIGIVGASGTGIQEVMAQVDRLGGGCSNVLGLGGRDLSGPVGAISCITALHALDEDSATDVIVLVSKPPSPEVREHVETVAASLGTPVVALFIGERASNEAGRDGVYHAHTCADAAEIAVELEGSRGQDLDEGQRGIRGLYTGGTLASEASMLIEEAFGIPPRDEHPRGIMLDHGPHRIVDLGDDAYTDGRPHPMIDPTSRAERIPAVFEDPEVAVVLLDVVIGHGSGEDPATPVARAVREGLSRAHARGRSVHVVASVCGTAGDPQGLDAQVATLREVGIRVLPSNAAAVRHAIAIATRPPREQESRARRTPAPVARLIGSTPSVLNIGLASFTGPVAASGAPVVQVDWAPTAGGDEHLTRLLRALATA